MEKGDPDIMSHKPRERSEPIINHTMQVGITIQTIIQTSVVLFAFGVGLTWSLPSGAAVPLHSNPMTTLLQQNWRGIDVQLAETMAFLTLSLCELFRAYTVRSERASLFQIGVFSNRYMQAAVGASILLLLAVCTIPLLQPIFNTRPLNINEWIVVFSLSLLPALAEEITKFFLRLGDRKQAA